MRLTNSPFRLPFTIFVRHGQHHFTTVRHSSVSLGITSKGIMSQFGLTLSFRGSTIQALHGAKRGIIINATSGHNNIPRFSSPLRIRRQERVVNTASHIYRTSGPIFRLFTVRHRDIQGTIRLLLSVNSLVRRSDSTIE